MFKLNLTLKQIDSLHILNLQKCFVCYILLYYFFYFIVLYNLFIPGFCVKTKEKSTNKKIFLNICQTDAIPSPKDISEAELIHIMDTDEIVDYRIPMSIGDVRSEPDKKGEDASVCDIAINPVFFQKLNASEVFREFFLAVAFEALQEKHKIYTEAEKRILQNKKAHGTLQMQRIQKREVEKKMGLQESLPTVDEFLNRGESSKGKIIEVMSDNTAKTPEYRFFKKQDNEEVLYAEVYLPYVVSTNSLIKYPY